MKNFVYAAIGGSGSTYLIKNLSKKYIVGNKPDTVLRTPEININIDRRTFEKRSHGYRISIDESIYEIIPKYIQYLRSQENHTAVFNTAAEYSIFSKNMIRDVIFLIRHPLHAYISWGKPERHKDVVDHLGGLNSLSAIKFFANRWKAFTDECIKLENLGILGGVIRFEFAHFDAKKIGGIEWVFAEFDINKRNFGYLEKNEQFLKEIVSENYFYFYERWNI